MGRCSRLCGGRVEVAAAGCVILRGRGRWRWRCCCCRRVALGRVHIQHGGGCGFAVAWAPFTAVAAITVARTAFTALLLFGGRAALGTAVHLAAGHARLHIRSTQVQIRQAGQRRSVHKIGRHCGLGGFVLGVRIAWATFAAPAVAIPTITPFTAWAAFATGLLLTGCRINASALAVRAFDLGL